MKKILLAFCVFAGSLAFGQTMPDFSLIRLEKTSDYRAAEPFALQTANYMLSTPVDKKSDNRLKSIEFLAKWMSGTTDYAFVFDDAASKVSKDDRDLFGTYMAAMVKYALSNKAAAKDAKVLKLNAMMLLLDYCGDDGNRLKMTRQLKKLSEARARGELEQALSAN